LSIRHRKGTNRQLALVNAALHSSAVALKRSSHALAATMAGQETTYDAAQVAGLGRILLLAASSF
jgi:hypothetical protein